MALTTFSGPVKSLNGFITGTATSPIVETTAGNVSQSYATTSATTGDTRLSYNKLTFTSTGSGETLRAFSVVTGTGAATAGTINGAHISLEVNGASGTNTGEIPLFANIETGPAATCAPTATSVTTVGKVIKVMIAGTVYYVPAYTTFG